MPLGIDRSHCKDDIIFRKFHGSALNVADPLDVLPFRAGSPTPDNLVGRGQTSGRDFPC